MSDLNFQRGKSFADVSRALTETKSVENENGETLVASAAENEQRSTHHPAEPHPALEQGQANLGESATEAAEEAEELADAVQGADEADGE